MNGMCGSIQEKQMMNLWKKIHGILHRLFWKISITLKMRFWLV